MATKTRRTSTQHLFAAWAVMLLACLGLLLAIPRTALAVAARDPELLPEGIDPGCRSHTFDLLTYDDLRSEPVDDRLTAPVEGEVSDVDTSIPLVMIVIGFDNLPYEDTYDWHSQVFQGDWSLAQYYYDMSNGKFTFLPAQESSAYDEVTNTNNADQLNDGVIHVKLDRDKAYSWVVVDGRKDNVELSSCLIEALEKAGDYIDFSAYDTNGDGYIQTSELAVGFVVAGKDAAVEDVSSIDDYEYTWPHAYTINNISADWGTPEAPEVRGAVVDSYIMMTETTMVWPDGVYTQGDIGTLAHELGHYLGLPDLYDTYYKHDSKWGLYSVGYVSLMYNGNYGEDLEGNARPFSLDMWSRVELGWVDPVQLYGDESDSIDIAGSLTSTETPIAYLFSTPNTGEYYLVENRRFTSWDEGMGQEDFYPIAALPDNGDGDNGGGLIFWHIDSNIVDKYSAWNQVNNINHHPGVMPAFPEENADGTVSMMGELPIRKRPFFSADLWGEDLFLPVYGTVAKDTRADRMTSTWCLFSLDSESAPVMHFHKHRISPDVLWGDDYSSATLQGECKADGREVILETTTNIVSEVLEKPSSTESGGMEYTAYFVMDGIEETCYVTVPPLDAEAITARDLALSGLSELVIGANATLATGAYTTESFDALDAAIDAANALFEDDTTTEDDVAAAREELLRAWRELEAVNATAQEQEIARRQAVYELAELLGGIYDDIDVDAYKPAALAEFVQEVDAAYDMLADKNATADQLAATCEELVRDKALFKRDGVRVSIAGAEVGGLAATSYTGRALEPVPTVTVGGVALVAGTDYDVSYRSNKDVGTATVTVTGKGDYAGTAEATFEITASRWARLAGKNAVETMRQIVRADGVFTAKSVGTVVVAGRRDFRGALAGVALAGLYGAPLVTTDGKAAALSAPAKAELQRLKPSRVLVVGDAKAVPEKHLKAIRSALPKAKVVRVSGKSASATAVAVATVGKTAPTKWGKTCIVATQSSFKDAMSIAPYAYAKHAPIYFTESTRLKDGKGLSAATLKAIKAAGYTKVIIVGGEQAVPKSVEAQLKGISCQRLAGKNAIDTCRLIAQFELQNGMNRRYLAVATTKDYADALAGAALAGAQGSVLVLTNPDGGLDAFDAVYSADELVRGHILGGTSAISESNAIHFRES